MEPVEPFIYKRQMERVDDLMFEASGTKEMQVLLTEVSMPGEKANFRVEIITSIFHELFLMYSWNIWVRMPNGQLEI